MKHHSKYFEIYTTFHALIRTQHSTVMKCFRGDFGGEYTSNKFYELLALYRTIYQTLCIDTLEQNDIVEIKHRHIVKTTRSLLLFASVPSMF